jgi:hypothetical protein
MSQRRQFKFMNAIQLDALGQITFQFGYPLDEFPLSPRR